VCAKSRLVAKDFQQLPGIDYEETNAPVAGTNTQRILIVLATIKKPHMRQFDVNTAYLHGEIDKKIYVKVPLVTRVKRQKQTNGPIYWNFNKASMVSKKQVACGTRLSLCS
jgi:hypothetical protein